jgi:hypothetical protein
MLMSDSRRLERADKARSAVLTSRLQGGVLIS